VADGSPRLEVRERRAACGIGKAPELRAADEQHAAVDHQPSRRRQVQRCSVRARRCNVDPTLSGLGSQGQFMMSLGHALILCCDSLLSTNDGTATGWRAGVVSSRQDRVCASFGHHAMFSGNRAGHGCLPVVIGSQCRVIATRECRIVPGNMTEIASLIGTEMGLIKAMDAGANRDFIAAGRAIRNWFES
jgi:hypothetical protein